MAINSKKKGNAFELYCTKILAEQFKDEFKRVPQSGAITGGFNRQATQNLRGDAKEILSGDIITPAWFKFHLECKFYNDEPKFHQVFDGKSLKLNDWLKQCDEDGVFANKIPLLIFKINRKGIYVVFDRQLDDMRYIDWPHMYYKDEKVIMSLEYFFIALGDSYYDRGTTTQDV